MTKSLAITILCLLNVFLLWRSFNNSNIQKEISEFEKRHTISQIIANDSHRIIKYDDGEPLSTGIELFTADHNATDLQSLMQDGNKLIFRIPSCIAMPV